MIDSTGVFPVAVPPTLICGFVLKIVVPFSVTFTTNAAPDIAVSQSSATLKNDPPTVGTHLLITVVDDPVGSAVPPDIDMIAIVVSLWWTWAASAARPELPAAAVAPSPCAGLVLSTTEDVPAPMTERAAA